MKRIDWDDMDPRLERRLHRREIDIMSREVCWDDLSWEVQDRFTAMAKREIEAAHKDAHDDARIDAHEAAA